MSAACTGQPLSWLTLERYRLDELRAGERQRVESHLAACPTCRSCLETIRADAGRELPPLPPSVDMPSPRDLGSWRLLRWVAAGTAVAVAAVVAVVLVTADLRKVAGVPPSRIATKGGELAMVLMRERQGTVLQDPGGFTYEDRFKVEVTCPPGESVRWDVLVWQDGKAAFPLAPALPLVCANRVALPGAFRITGEGRAVVCVLIGPHPPDRAELARRGLGALPADSVCTLLDPVR